MNLRRPRTGRREGKRLLLACLVAASIAWPCGAAVVAPCVGTTLRVVTFHLLLAPRKGGPALPLRAVNVIRPGDKLKYEPGHLPASIRNKARIALVLVPSAQAKAKRLEVLPAQAAKSVAEWTVPIRASVVGVVFGPRGLDVKKVTSLVEQNPDLIPELAAYAQQSSTVNALVETLSQYDQSPPGSEDLDAVLKGFSSQYNVILPPLDTREPTQEQATKLLHAVLPAVSTYNPLASQRGAMVEQSTGLAASVASLFYGTPIGLAAGGAQLFENLRTLVFPGTDFRAAFAQKAGGGGIELCSRNQPPKPRTRIAYLWMLRVPDAKAPSASLAGAGDVPLGSAATLKVTCATLAALRLLPRARDWRLVSSRQEFPVPVKVSVAAPEDTLSLDLRQAKLPAGKYHLVALWDWKPFKVAGSVDLQFFSSFASARLSPDSADELVQGNGIVPLKLIGANFEFVRKVSLVKANDPGAESQNLAFMLPKGEAAGDQLSMTARVNTSLLTPGPYLLRLTQSNDNTQTVRVTVHPPNPKIANLPLRVNLGEKQQVIVLRGTGLERIEQMKSQGLTWALEPLPAGSRNVTERRATLSLDSGARAGDLLDARMQVDGIDKPVEVPGAVQVAGPLPEILTVKESFPNDESVALRSGELPAGERVSFAIQVANAGLRPAVALACTGPGAAQQTLALQPGDTTSGSQLDDAGQGLLFLSLDPGTIGRSGCALSTSVTNADTGVSAPYSLGRVVRLPRIDKFMLSDREIGANLYAGMLTGQNLQVVQETGWNARDGFPVQGIPTPVPGNPQEQTLEIELPWPPPSPHAPVYVWLLGETQGRKTDAVY